MGPGLQAWIMQVSEYPCPHGCTNHTVKSESPTACGHYHSPSEWGHHEQKHNSEYWQAIGNGKEIQNDGNV